MGRVGFRRVLTAVLAVAMFAGQFPATALGIPSAAANAVVSPGKVLILGPSVTGGTSSPEAVAATNLGLAVEIVDATQWGAKTATDFASYRALILGDPTCQYAPSPYLDAANANKTTWGPQVTGNVVIVGTDPVYHSPARAGAKTLIEKGINFATSDTANTGAYVSLSCYYEKVLNSATHINTPVPVLDAFVLDGFTVKGVGCHNDVHIAAAHPAIDGLTNAALSNWACSVHEAFDKWPSSFQVLALAKDSSATFTTSDGTKGQPYILARGEFLTLAPASAQRAPGEEHTVTATVTKNGVAQPDRTVTIAVAGAHSRAATTLMTGASGNAIYTYPGTTTGTDVVTATYGAFTRTATVDWRYATTTTAQPASATYGAASVPLSATVVNVSGGTAPVPTGGVTFTVKQGEALVGTVTGTFTAGATSASFPLAGVSAGSYTIEASYPEGLVFRASSGTAAFTVAKATTTTTVQNVTGLTGHSVTFGASVTSPTASTVNVGNVSFTATGGATLGPVVGAVASGSTAASLSLAGVAVGAYSLSGTYGATTNFLGSTGASTLTVVKGILGYAICGDLTLGGAAVTLLSPYGETSHATVNATVTGEFVFSGAFVQPGEYQIRAQKGGQFCGARLTVALDGTAFLPGMNTLLVEPNHSWPTALTLALGPEGTVFTGTLKEHLHAFGASAFVRVRVETGDLIKVRLQGLDFPADLLAYRNPFLAFQGRTTVSDLSRLGAEFAPQDYSPQDYSPQDYSPQDYSPQDYSPQDYSPQDYSPQDYSPQDYSPQDYSPQDYSPQHAIPGEPMPTNASDSALARSRVGVSAREGTADEFIVGRVWGDPGYIYLQVTGRRGAFSVGDPFTLNVRVVPGNCGNLVPIGAAAVAPGASGGATVLASGAAPYRTVVVTDLAKIAGSPTDKAELVAAATAFVNQVNGVFLDVSTDARVSAAAAQADLPANAQCPYAKNLVATEVKRIIDSYRPSVENVLLAGGDAAIPFFREADHADLARESLWSGPPVDTNSFSQAAFRRGYVLSQVRYGAQKEFAIKNQLLPIADLGVGRAVETAAEAAGLIRAYLAQPGGQLSVTTAPLVTGYGNMTDGATGIAEELAAGTGLTPQTLLHAGGPNAVGAWSADQLRTLMLGCASGVCTAAEAGAARHELSFVAMHASQGSALAADYKTVFLASDIENATVNMTNTISFVLGCHYGYNTLDAHRLAGASEPDFAQAYARKLAHVISGTGYQYFDTDIADYGERSYLSIVRKLRTAGTRNLGHAVAAGLVEYITASPEEGTHVKQYLQTALYGIPNLKVGLSGVILSGGDTSVVTGASGPTALGLRTADLDESFTLVTHARGPESFLAGSAGTYSSPGQPILPREQRNVTLAGYALRGVGIRSGVLSDLSVTPVIGTPTTEDASATPQFFSNVLHPVQPWRVSYVEAVTGGATRLHILPAQHVSTAATTATRRRFDAMGLRLFYSNNTSDQALVGQPAITNVRSTVAGGVVTFSANVSSGRDVPTHQVWVTYYTVGGTQLLSVDLAQDLSDPTLWTGTLPTAAHTDLRYVVQAANGIGLVRLDSNNGAYYGVPGPVAAAVQQRTSLALTSTVFSGTFNDVVTLSAKLTTIAGDVVGETLNFYVGSDVARVQTGAGGVATAILRLARSTPGQQPFVVSFGGSSSLLGTATVATPTVPAIFSVAKMPTALTLTTPAAAVQYSDPTALSATLSEFAGANLPLDQRAIVFTLTSATGAFAAIATTDASGKASLFAPAAPGSYTVTAQFLGDDNYAGSQATAAGPINISSEDGSIAYTGDTVVPLGTALDLASRITLVSDGAPGDLSVARVRYVANNGSGTVVHDGEATIGNGSWPASVAGLPVGVYSVEVTERSGVITQPNTTALVAVFDASSSAYVTGGGWIASNPGSYRPALLLTGRATFGFVAKPAKGATTLPSGSTEFQFRAAGLTFHSTSYDWFLVQGGDTAKFKGKGRLNGVDGYEFMIWAVDGGPGGVDRFRIKISNAGGETVYDNKHGESLDADPQAIGGGSVVIHNPK